MTKDDENLEGLRIDLGDSRYVFVASLEDRFLIEFRNSTGGLTHIALSREAGDALRYLLGDPQPTEETIRRFLVHMTQAAGQAAPTMAWQEVKNADHRE